MLKPLSRTSCWAQTSDALVPFAHHRLRGESTRAYLDLSGGDGLVYFDGPVAGDRKGERHTTMKKNGAVLVERGSMGADGFRVDKNAKSKKKWVLSSHKPTRPKTY